METLANLESFVRAAEGGSFSEAGRRLGLTAAAVSRNVAMLERNLGVRLFQRSTRKLTLTEAGERFLVSIDGNLDALQAAIAEAAAHNSEPSGVLKVSLSPTFGVTHILPLLPPFLARYPRIKPEWHFENRPVDLIAENYDAAIGGAFNLAPGLVSRALAPVHIVAVASPAYMSGRSLPADPSGLAAYNGIAMRSPQTGRIRRWMFRNANGIEVPGTFTETIVVNDPAAMREAARLGLGMSLIALVDVLPDLERGDLIRLLPDWYADAGTISLYYASRTLISAKTRVFVDFVVSAFESKRLDHFKP
ncbi:LysR family transcriptional regulator [Paraburkholderia sp. CNPSo 3076]|uniref:LysR family transcriptional regulator n=1 Tax=Paraburkholderia sp. CNPSo 3076 TaxID=2940936 RepID=UPI00225503A4|nr:LysR family transcriptional regulator [Paraburkholderia sp. CNPSo 3076]MCX5537937.1 LysR family transcriptional regulator [Paraburkholderia sp. CNPSo 3076]